MPDVTAKDNASNEVKTEGTMTTRAESREVSDSDPRPALHACYGQIGISAVAAAAKYQGHAKNPAYAPAPNDWRTQYERELA